MSVDITSIVIQAKSDGIDQATKSLNSLAEAAGNAETSVGKISSASVKTNSSANETRESVNKLIATYQKQVDLLGATTTQINAYSVATKGGDAAQQQLAMSLGAQVDAYKRLSQNQAEAIRMNKAMDQAAKDNKATADQFIKSLEIQAGAAGLTGKALQAYNAELLRTRAAQLGVTDQTSGFIQKLQDTEKASGHAASGVSGIFRELLVLGHEASQGQFTRLGGSMIVLAERADVAGKSVAYVTERAANLGTSIGAVLGPIALVIAAFATAGVVIYNFYKASQNYHELTNALALTNNYAGASADSLLALARAATVAGGSISSAKTTVLELAASGKFTADQIGYITEAAIALERSAGVSTKDTIKHFEDLATQATTSSNKSTDMIAKDALKLNDHYHYLTAGIYEQIVAFEKQGDTQTALSISLEAYANNVEATAKKIEANMSPLMKFFKEMHDVASAMWDAISQKNTDATQKAALQYQLKTFDEPDGGAAHSSKEDAAKYRQTIANKIAEIDKRLDAQLLIDQATAQKQQLEQEKIHGQARMNTLTDQYDKTNKALKDLAQFDAAWEKQNEDYKTANYVDHMIARGNILEKTHEKEKKLRAEGTSAIDAELRAIQASSEEKKKALENDVSALAEAYKAQKISVFDYVEQTNTKLLEEQANTTATRDKEYKALDDSIKQHKYNATELNVIAGKRSEITKQYIDAYSKEGKALEANGNLISDIASKSAAAQAESDKKALASIQTTIDKLQDKVNAYKNLPDAIKLAGVSEKQIQDSISESTIQRLKDEQAQIIENNNIEDPMMKARLAFLDMEIAKLGIIKGLQVQDESQQATNKAIQDYNEAWKRANKQIGDDLASAIIDGGGKGWKKLIKDMELAFAKLVLNPIISPISNAIASAVTPGSALVSGASGVGTATGLAGIAGSIASVGVGASQTAAALLSGQIGFGSTLSAGIGAIGTGTSAGITAGLSSVIGTLAPIALGIAAVVKLLDKGTETNTRLQFANNNAAGNISINERGNQGQSGSNYIGNNGTSSLGTFGVNSTFWMNADQKVVQDFISGVSKSDDALAQFLTTTEKANVALSLTGKTYQANTGAEKDNPNATGQLDKVYTARIHDIMEGVETGLASLTDSFVGTSDQLGMEAQALLQYRQALKDSGEAVFGVKVTLQEVAAFKAPTEATSAALTRVTTVFTSTNTVLAAMGKTSEEVFGKVGLASYDLRQSLITAAGGADVLISAVNSFSDGFLTDAEKIAPVQKQLSAALVSLGYAADTSKDAYKALVTSQDLSTDAGQKMYVALLALAPAFTQVEASSESSKQALIDQAKAQSDLRSTSLSMQLTIAQLTDDTASQTAIIAQQRQIELDAMDASLRPLQVRINQLNDEAAATKAANDAQAANLTKLKASAQGDFNVLSAAITKAKASAQAAYDAQAAILNAQISSLSTVKSNIDSLSSALESALNSMIDNTAFAMTRASAQASLDAALASAKAGNLPTADSLKDTLSTLGKDSSGSFSNYIDYAKDQGITAGKLADLNKLAKDQGSIVEQQLKVAQDTLTQAKTNLDAELAKYDMILAVAQQQLDAMNGVQVAVMSLAAALAAFNKSSGSAINAGVSAGTIGAPQAATTDQITGLYQTLLGRAPDAGGLAFYQLQASHGATASQLAQDILSSPEYAGRINGSHAGGADNIPFDGYTAKLHKGEMVIPAKKANDVAQGSDMSAIVTAINELKDDNSVENRSMLSDIKWLRKLFQNMAPNGQTLQTTQTVIS